MIIVARGDGFSAEGAVAKAIGDWLSTEVKRRASVVSTASKITFRPSAFADALASDMEPGVSAAFRFFLGSVALVLAIEAVFSFAFDTAFSDIVHHSFPVLVVLLGGVTVYLCLKLLFTPDVSFNPTLGTTLYVGGAAILFMITSIFALLTADFLVSYPHVKASPCEHRTIICLLSGGTLNEYAVPRKTSPLGWSFPVILFVNLATLLHYSRVLAKALRASMGVSPWRTYIAAAITVIVLSPLSLMAVNAVYRFLYGST